MPLVTAGMCTPDCILFHVCVRISVIFVALPHPEWKSVILFGGDFLLQSRWEDSCWLCVVITLYFCKCIPSLFWTSCLTCQSEPSTTEDSADTRQGQPGWRCEVGRCALLWRRWNRLRLSYTCNLCEESCTHRYLLNTLYIVNILSCVSVTITATTKAQDKTNSEFKSACC